MAVSGNTKKRFALATGLRGLFMLLAGIYAIIWPTDALTVMVLALGIMLIIEGVFGLWNLTFGGGTSPNYWLNIVGHVLSLIIGIMILVLPILATVMVASFGSSLFGLGALFFGLFQIVTVWRERDLYVRIWPVVLSGIAYVLLGLVMVFFPLLAASAGMIVGGILLVFLAIGLLGFAWQLYQSSRAA